MGEPCTIVLVGSGHAHLHVVSRAAALRKEGAKVVLVDPDTFWYSGLATGMLGGMYEAADDQVDPRALAQANGVEFIQDRVESVDASRRRLRLKSGAELTYDYLSLNVGSRVKSDAIAGAENDPSVWMVKPISNLWKLREHLESCFHEGRVPRVAVVGGGPTGCEIAANLMALAAHHRVDMRVTLIARGEVLIKNAPEGAGRALERKLAERGLTILKHTSITRREGAALIAEDGRRIEADLVVLGTGLVAAGLVYETGLPTDEQEGLRVSRKLNSIADPRVFASGDCAALEGHKLPKLGVFGVRQSRFIHGNLLASLEGKPLKEYKPQKRYLAILNLGDGSALSTWGPLWWNGRSSMWLKNWIDRRFLKRYRSEREGQGGILS